MIKSVPYVNKQGKLTERTIDEFDLSKRDVRLSISINSHKKDHIKKNK